MVAEMADDRSAELRTAIEAMCGQAGEMLRLTWEGFRRQDREMLGQAEALGRTIHRREKELTPWVIGQLKASPPAGADRGLLFAPSHLERIGDHIEDLVRGIRGMMTEGVLFTERGLREINTLFEQAVELLQCTRDAVQTGNRVLFHHIPEAGDRFQSQTGEFALAHQQRLIEGVCVPRASSLYLAILDALRGIERHTREIARQASEAFAGK